MTIIRYTFLLFSLILLACGAKKNAGNGNDSHGGPDPISEHTPFFENIAQGDSLFASIQKGYCFGTCPVYEMKIYNSGFVTFEGKANVDLIGKHTGRVTKDQMLAFYDMANEIGYFEMEDEYDNPGISDLPSTTTSLLMAGKRKTVRRRYGYPTTIKAFEKVFEDLIKEISWSPGIELK